MTMPGSVMADAHVCPLSDGPKPHVGGVISPPCVPTVLALNRPATPAPGNLCVCVSPAPNTTAKGSATVLIQNRMWARVTDTTAHGGTITGPGAATVLVGG
ncbi:MAG: PAAR domain-containing protein [Pseudomonadota bacterium]